MGEKGAGITVALSDLVTAEFRGKKYDTEFPLSLDLLESFLRQNGIEHIDYAFLPWLTTQREMIQNGQRLFTLGMDGQEPFPVSQARLLGINMMNYLQAPALFTLLELAGIPVFRQDRSSEFPLIILGGHIWPNPLPLSDFYDVMVAGEGEETLCQITELTRYLGGNKDQLLRAIAKLKGVYVPGYTQQPIQRVQIDYPDPIYPTGNLHVRSRVGAVVLSRGCPFSCAFCNNQLVGGQYRLKPYNQVIRHIDWLKQQGVEKVILVAASVSSYQSEGKTALDIMTYIRHQGLAVKGISDRPERYTPEYLRISTQETGKVIIAPEVSPRIRKDILRKTISEEILMEAVSAAIEAGVNRIQLYVILAIPSISPGVVEFLPGGFAGEQPEDIRYLAELGMAIASRMQQAGLEKPAGKPYVLFDCMPFIPAIGSSMQRVRFPSYAEFQLRLSQLSALITAVYRGLVDVSPGMDKLTHLLQAFLERSDARAGRAVWRAWKRTWPDSLQADDLEDAIADAGYNLDELSSEYLANDLPYTGLIEGIS